MSSGLEERAGHPVLIRTAALLIGLAVALALAEVALRLLDLAPADGVATVTASEFERVPGLFMPNQQVLDRRKPDLPHLVTIDSLGYRGAHFPRRKPEDEFRILFVGDSGTWGDFVDDEKTLPAQLEAILNQRCKTVRVVNAGLGGSSIRSQANMIQRSLTVEPDLVLIKFNENDIDDLAGEPIWDRIERNRITKSRFPFSLVYPVLRRTALWHLTLRVRARDRNRAVAERVRHGKSPRGGPVQVDSVELQARDKRRELYARTLASIRDDLTTREVPLAVVTFPGHKTLRGSRSEDQLIWVRDTAVELNIVVIETLGPIRASGLSVEELYLLPRDGHASPLGYRVAAEHLAAAIAADLTPSGHCLSPEP